MSDTIKKHSPLKNTPLRQAGESLNDKLQEILYVKIMSVIIAIFFVFFMAVYDLFRLYFNIEPRPSVWFLSGILLILFYRNKLQNYWQEAKNTGLGMRGERIVSEMLYGLKKDGYEIFNDLINAKGNIDHIIVGPAGVFTVETKTASKAGGDQRISYDGENIRIDGWIPSRNIIKQALAEKYWLEDFIAQRTEKTVTIKVTPVVIYPGWFIDPSCHKSTEVMILNDDEKGLPAQLQKMERTLSEEQIDILSKHIGDRIRECYKGS
ncbi:MAG: NERD domain-containing protein [Candidatus Paceibacterota bacterium]